MPRLSKDFKQAIEEIPVHDLQKLVMQAAAKNQEIYDMINLQYLADKDAENELFENIKEQTLGEILLVSDRGVVQKNLAKAINKAVRHINHYKKVTSNKVGEANLLLALLNEVFEEYADYLGTCWTAFDSKLAVTTNRLYNLITKKLHEDYRIEYQESLNNFLKTLHAKSNHLDYIYNMPYSMEL